MSAGRCNMQTAGYRQTMDRRLGTRGKMAVLFPLLSANRKRVKQAII